MKKLLCSVLVLCFSIGLLFSEIYQQHRFFEFGFDVNAGLSNNYFSPIDLLVSDLVLDLQKIEDEMPGRGLVFDFLADGEFYLRVNASEKLRLKLFADIDGSGYANISRELFELLGKGLNVPEKQEISIKTYADLFLDAGLSVKSEFKKHGIRFDGIFFVPIMYMPNSKGSITYSTERSGLLEADVDIPLTLYSVVDMDSLKSLNPSQLSTAISKAFGNGGFAIRAEVEHKITKTFEMGLFTQIPIVPGKLKNKTQMSVKANFSEQNFLGKLDNTEKMEKAFEFNKPESSKADFKVHKPLIVGLEGAWRPFGNWCTFTPMMDLKVKSAFMKNPVFIFETGLTADFSLFNILGCSFTTAYINRVFIQTAGFMLNARVFEINFDLMLRGADFANCFRLSGAGAKLGIKFGF